MRCATAGRLMAASLCHALGPSRQTRFREHIRKCRGCREEWAQMQRTADLVERVAPRALTTDRDLAADALAQASNARAAAGTTRSRASRAVRWALATTVTLALAGYVTSRGHVVVALERALQAQPSHTVERKYDAGGDMLSEREEWHAANGDSCGHYKHSNGNYHRWIRRPRQNITWSYRSSDNTLSLGWPGVTQDGVRERVASKARDIGLVGAGAEPIRRMVAFAQLAGIAIKLRQGAGHFHGEKAKLITWQVVEPSGSRDEPAQRVIMRYYLTPDASRLLGAQTDRYSDGRLGMTGETWPVEYGVEPPPSALELDVPPGAAVRFGTRSIQPVWEAMAQGEKQRVRRAAQGALKAWAAGDFHQFAQHYDFAAGTDYAVKGKFTAEQMTETWRDLTRRQRGRWQNSDIRFDYAFATCEPPPNALGFFSMYRKNPESGGNWILYRQKPTDEPGIVALARMYLTDTEGNKRSAGTQLFLKEIDGRCRVILWRPPFD